MVQFFTALLVFSHFNPDLPKPADIQNLPKAQLVRKYSNACLQFFKKPEFQGYDLAGLAQNMLSSLGKSAPKSESGFIKSQVNPADLLKFYNKVCRANPDPNSLNEWDGQLKEALNQYVILRDRLPEVDVNHITLAQATDVLSADKKVIADIYVRENRRRNISLSQLPPYIPKIFVTIEDARFFDHTGVDEIGILRAILKDMASQGSRQGASTISQQVARNLYLGFAPTLQRKLQEILIAAQIEKQMNKEQILELYLNLIYFGRNSWGIEKAAQSYFGKSARNLTPLEGAFLAGIVHGPNLYRYRPDRIERRVRFVLGRMKDRSLLPAGNYDIRKDLKIRPDGDPYNAGYIRDATVEAARRENPTWITDGGIQLQTSVNSDLQLLTSNALQNGLTSLERSTARPGWKGPLENIQEALTQNSVAMAVEEKQRKMESDKEKQSPFSALKQADAGDGIQPSGPEKYWQRPLSEVAGRYPLPVTRWQLSVLLQGRKMGLVDGGECEISAETQRWSSVKRGDVVYVQSNGRQGCEIQYVPAINGAAIVMEADTGQILAMSGGFSYQSSSWNRAVLALRQPGSLLKPFTYLTALQRGFQPNMILSDNPIFYPSRTRGGKEWSPQNYDRKSVEPHPMRFGLENSRNLMTIRLAEKVGLNPIRRVTEEFGLYEQTLPDLSFVLGAQEVSLLNMTKAYAQIANGGVMISPQILDQVVDLSKQTAMKLRAPPKGYLTSVDEISLYQIRLLLQGVVAQGTASMLGSESNYFAGKTGTSNESKDVWFVGFTPHLVIGVFIGYDNPETLGAKTTGGMAALPIVSEILRGSYKIMYLPETFPSPPSGVVMLPTDRTTGEILPVMGENSVLEAYRQGTVKEPLR